jgi:Ca2+-dependent lipid-binding protein
MNLPKADVTGFSDPYVVFTCNGKTRTSSVKLQTLNPEWNGRLLTAELRKRPQIIA